MYRIVAIFLLVMLSVFGRMAEAAPLPEAVSDSELVRLPPYCAARMKMPQDSPEARRWRAQIGANFLDFFHYCAGLNYINRYWGAHNGREQKYYLERAEANFNYIVHALKPDFTMGAELYSNRGEVYKLQGKVALAAKDFIHSMNVDPANTKPYLQLADLYTGNNQKGHALETITEGLRYNPDSKALRRRYLELGGKEPFPEPAAEARAEPAAVKPAEAVLPEPKTEPAKATNMNDVETSSPQSVAGEAAAKQDSGVPIGNSKNPYCRFCPD